MSKLTVHEENAAIARHGWVALLNLLEHKGLITGDERLEVITRAHQGAANFEAFGIVNTAEPKPRDA
jgi:hypothetical protein